MLGHGRRADGLVETANMTRVFPALLSPLAAVAVVATLAARPAPVQGPPGDDKPPLSMRVDRAITRGVEHLLSIQAADGRWLGGYEERYPGGYTALVCFTLRRSGVRPDAPGLARGRAALLSRPPQSTYGAAARLLYYETEGNDPATTAAARVAFDFLLEHQRGGLWGYPADPLDMSNVQFALLGLRAGALLGFELPDDVLRSCAEALWSFQAEDGGFLYAPEDNRTAGITAATLAGLAVLEEFAVEERGLARILKKHDKDRQRAHAWLVERWDPARDAYGTSAWTSRFPFAFLWAVERYGDLTEQERLGEHDWYADGAQHLLSIQHSNGSFGEKLEHTAFALLFLRRAVLSGGPDIDELYARIDADWNESPPATLPTPQSRVPWLTDWLVAGPFLGERDATGLVEPPFKPARLRVKKRAKVGRKSWDELTLPADRWGDLEALTGRAANQAVWVVGTCLDVPGTNELEAALWLDLEDGWRVFLDAEELASGRRVASAIRGDVHVPLRLAPGHHELWVLVEDVGGAAAFGARLAAPDGAPLADALVVGRP